MYVPGGQQEVRCSPWWDSRDGKGSVHCQPFTSGEPPRESRALSAGRKEGGVLGWEAVGVGAKLGRSDGPFLSEVAGVQSWAQGGVPREPGQCNCG